MFQPVWVTVLLHRSDFSVQLRHQSSDLLANRLYPQQNPIRFNVFRKKLKKPSQKYVFVVLMIVFLFLLFFSVIGKLFFSDFLVSHSLYPSFVFYSACMGIVWTFIFQKKYRRLLNSIVTRINQPVVENNRHVFLVFLLNLSLFALWSLYILSDRKDYLFVHYDGRYILHMALNALEEQTWRNYFASGILQGLGMGIEYPINAYLDFGIYGSFILTSSFSNLDFRVVAYFIWGLMLFSSTYILARKLSFRNSYSVIASWLSVLLTIYPTPLAISGIIGHVPPIATVISINVLATTILIDLPYKKSISQIIWRSLTFFILITYGLAVNPLWMIVIVPWLATIVIVQIIRHCMKTERISIRITSYIFCISPVSVAYLASLISLLLYTNALLFPKYMEKRSLLPSQATYFFESDMLYKAILAITFTFIIAQVKATKFLSTFQLTVVISSSFYLLIGTIIVIFGLNWNGPQISYFEIVIFPFFAIILARILNVIDEGINLRG